MDVKKVIVGLITCLLFSCSGNNSYEAKSIVIKDQESKPANLTTDFDWVSPIYLNNKEVLLGRIKDIKFYQDEVYILTESKGNGLYVFDSEGKFLRKIGSPGSGPEEYKYFQSFIIRENEIYLLDREAKRIVKYSTQGEFISTLVNGIYGFDLSIKDDELIVYAGNMNLDNQGIGDKILFYDIEGNFLNSTQKIDAHEAEFLHIIPQNVFSDISNIYLEPFSKELYQIQGGDIKLWRNLDFGSKSLPDEALEKGYGNIAEFITEIRKKDYAINYNNIRETNEYYVFTYELNDPSNPNMVFINKDTEEVSIFNGIFENLISSGLKLSFKEFKLVGNEDDSLIFILYPYDLVDQDVKLNTVMSIDDNPIVFRLSLKI